MKITAIEEIKGTNKVKVTTDRKDTSKNSNVWIVTLNQGTKEELLAKVETLENSLIPKNQRGSKFQTLKDSLGL